MNAANQQLAFARVQAQSARHGNSPLARRAHWQAGVFQLNSALEAYAAELQQAAKLNFPLKKGRGMFGALLGEFLAAGVGSADIGELAHLERNPRSWLSILQQWAENLLELGRDQNSRSLLAETSLTQPPSDPNVLSPEEDDTGMIKVVDVDAESAGRSAFDEQLFEQALAHVAELFERQRTNSSEW